jgi:hypothetical protein
MENNVEIAVNWQAGNEVLVVDVVNQRKCRDKNSLVIRVQ